MKLNKNDGGLGLWSNHLMHGPPRLHILLSLLFTSMLKHGHVPHEFKVSTLLPIPKDLSKSVHVSNNYRPIALNISMGWKLTFQKRNSLRSMQTMTCPFVSVL